MQTGMVVLLVFMQKLKIISCCSDEKGRMVKFVNKYFINIYKNIYNKY